MERSINNEAKISNKRKAAIAIASGILATSIATGCSAEKGVAQLGGSIFNSSDVIYGDECIDHPKNYERKESKIRRGTIVDIDNNGYIDSPYLSSLNTVHEFREGGLINENNEPSDELIDEFIEDLEESHIEFYDKRIYKVKVKDGAKDQLSKSVKALIDDAQKNNQDDTGIIDVHAYGDPQNADVCAAWALFD